jgi:RNA methyltransferase, TrmH family
VSTITSPRNPRVRAAAALHRRRERDEQGRYLVEGPRYVTDLLAGEAVADVVEVFALPDAAAELRAAAEAAGVRLTTVTAEVIARLADSETPQGVVAVVRQRRERLEGVVGRGLLIVLDGVSEPGNAGTVVRTATAADAAGVVFTLGSVDPWNPKAVRASAGSVSRCRLVVGVTAQDVVDACAPVGQRVVALDTSGEDITRPGLLDPSVALLLGSEAHGLGSETLSRADRVAAITLPGPVESLNLGAAAAVAIFTAVHSTGGEG